MSATSPASKRSRSLSSSAPRSRGSLSHVTTTWLPVSWSALKVWKNSSSVRALLWRNWMSSTSRTSASRNRALNRSTPPDCSAPTNSLRERLAGGVADAHPAAVRAHVVTDRVEQVGLAHARRPVDEEGVVGLPGELRHRQCGGVGEAVAVADDELVEGVLGVERGIGPGVRGRRLTFRAPVRVCRPDDVDDDVGAQCGRDAGLEHAPEPAGHPVARLRRSGDREAVAVERDGRERREPELVCGVGDGPAQLRLYLRPIWSSCADTAGCTGSRGSEGSTEGRWEPEGPGASDYRRRLAESRRPASQLAGKTCAVSAARPDRRAARRRALY